MTWVQVPVVTMSVCAVEVSLSRPLNPQCRATALWLTFQFFFSLGGKVATKKYPPWHIYKGNCLNYFTRDVYLIFWVTVGFPAKLTLNLNLPPQPKLLSYELLDLVSSHFNLKEKEFFGLAFFDDKYVNCCFQWSEYLQCIRVCVCACRCVELQSVCFLQWSV